MDLNINGSHASNRSSPLSLGAAAGAELPSDSPVGRLSSQGDGSLAAAQRHQRLACVTVSTVAAAGLSAAAVAVSPNRAIAAGAVLLLELGNAFVLAKALSSEVSGVNSRPIALSVATVGVNAGFFLLNWMSR